MTRRSTFSSELAECSGQLALYYVSELKVLTEKITNSKLGEHIILSMSTKENPILRVILEGRDIHVSVLSCGRSSSKSLSLFVDVMV